VTEYSIAVLEDTPRYGEENMQIDHRLLHSANDPGSVFGLDRLPNAPLATGPLIVVRLYYWAEPTLSLGNFQSIQDLQSAEDTRTSVGLKSCSWVQRKTGGGAILHDQEVTYSIIVPSRCESLEIGSKGHNERLYRAVHQSVVEGLKGFGLEAALAEKCTCKTSKIQGNEQEPFLCFHRRTPVDVLIGEHKILGSAQRRVHSGLLQHGSFLVKNSPVYPSLLGVSDLVELSDRYLGFESRGDHQARKAWQDWLVDRIIGAFRGLIGPPKELFLLNLANESVRIM
jgi:lipoate-protein ligase A